MHKLGPDVSVVKSNNSLAEYCMPAISPEVVVITVLYCQFLYITLYAAYHVSLIEAKTSICTYIHVYTRVQLVYSFARYVSD